VGAYAWPESAADFTVRSPSAADSYFVSWAERHASPSLILSVHDGRVVWANRATLALAADGEDLTIHNGVLHFGDKAVQQDFRETLNRLGDEVCAWCFKRRGRDDHYVVSIERLAPEDEPPAVAMMFTETSRERQYVWCDIGSIFGLTRAEAAIVRRLAGGDRADVIAAELGIALDTVRTHIRRIYAKLEVNSREQLFSLVSPFRLG
jgi:DNA-binding CsgD family transcriptional regulator